MPPRRGRGQPRSEEGEEEPAGCCDVAQHPGESKEQHLARRDRWRAIIFLTLTVFDIAPMFIIMYFFDHGFTTWHKAKDAWIGMGTIGLLFLVTALYYLRRDVAGVWVSVHRPASMWALVVLCTAALIVIGVVRDDHEDMILRHRHWRQVTLFAVFGSLLVYSFFSALWVSRAVIARAWPDHRLPTPLMLLLGALTCGLCAATVFDVRAVFGMPSEMARRW